MTEKKIKKAFSEGPITADRIAKSIASHQSKTGIGAHSIFLGQVRADRINGMEVQGIEYSAYTEMAENKIHEIREAAFEKFNLNCMHIYHSLGYVATGEISLFVFTSSPHRNDCTEATRHIVEEIKNRAPIFGKEILADQSHKWKENQ